MALFSLSGQSEPVRLPRLCAALRSSFARGYKASDLRADVLAGAVVGVVALPLSMALAIATGVPPQHGIYTAIVAGTVIALLGGSKVQVSGPTAAFARASGRPASFNILAACSRYLSRASTKRGSVLR